MALLDKLAGLSDAVKNAWRKSFGDDVLPSEPEDAGAEDAQGAASVLYSVEDAWAVLGLPQEATLDEVRATARSLARRLHPAATKKDPAAQQAMERVARASELLEEHLLPVASVRAPDKPTGGSPGPRARATPRR